MSTTTQSDTSSLLLIELQRGFTLLEMAIVLTIIGLLLGGLLMPLSAQVEQRQISETQKALDVIKEALIGFAASHSAADTKPYLPCPDTTNDGQEDRTGTSCTNQEGNVPWATLGIADVDSWGNRFRYRVTAAFSNSATGFTLSSVGDITIRDAAPPGGNVVAASIPAIITSHGKNGLGAFGQSGGTNPAPTGADELANTNSDTIFVSRTPSDAAAPSGEFDDVVTWLSPNILFNRMISAQRLP